jgi:hypothetical protein
MKSSRQLTGRGRQRSNVADALRTDVPVPTTTDDNISSTPDVGHSGTTSQTIATTSGLGCGVPRRKIEAPDPHWTVSDLTIQQFQSNARPSKPTELGTIGQPIEVTVNYFPVRKFPDSGLVYQYHIEIKNKQNSQISSHQRR